MDVQDAVHRSMIISILRSDAYREPLRKVRCRPSFDRKCRHRPVRLETTSITATVPRLRIACKRKIILAGPHLPLTQRGRTVSADTTV